MMTLKGNRVIISFFLMLLLLIGLIMRLFWLSASDNPYKETAETHGNYVLKVTTTRGTIYDSSMNPLVNNENAYYAAVMPDKKNAPALLNALSPYVLNLDNFIAKMKGNLPFSIKISSPNIQSPKVKVIRTYQRYSSSSVAPQVVGYINSDGTGVTGIEKSYDSLLKSYSQTINADYAVDAMGKSLEGVPVDISVQGKSCSGGVELTLNSYIQNLAQKAADKYLQAGAVVVMDVKNGDILACVSNPGFNQNDIAGALKGKDSPMLNRAFTAYNLGSVFKIAVTAAALQSGISPNFTYTCTGLINVSGKDFHCHYLPGHGTEDMKLALANSCNPYYITLGQKTGADKILAMAKSLGFGSSSELAPGLKTDDGILPSSEKLKLPAALANFSMGEGDFMATPVQVACMVCAVANDGLLPTPRLVKATVDEKKQVHEIPGAVPDRVFSKDIASTIRSFMIYTVDSGTGSPAKPAFGGAGGKTATAETGWLKDGKLINQAWFAGFYPAQNPQYAVVAMLENGAAGGSDAGPVFKYIADGIAPTLGYPVNERNALENISK